MSFEHHRGTGWRASRTIRKKSKRNGGRDMTKLIGMMVVFIATTLSLADLSHAGRFCGSEAFKGSQRVPDVQRFGDVEVQFWASCDHHDRCYEEGASYITQKYGSNTAGRAAEAESIRGRCDRTFHSNLRLTCEHQLGGRGALLNRCLAWADAYFVAVSAAGGTAFFQAIGGN